MLKTLNRLGWGLMRIIKSQTGSGENGKGVRTDRAEHGTNYKNGKTTICATTAKWRNAKTGRGAKNGKNVIADRPGN